MIFKFIQQVNKTNTVHYCTNSAKNKIYSSTVLLPKTKFPLRLEGQKLAERDQYINDAVEFDNLYSWQRSHLDEPEFVLHDGPPYANGQPHMGHAINKILKDTILRYHVLKGNKVHFVPGWDCHGLPIELKAVGDASDMDPLEIRTKARHFAQQTIATQKEVFRSWGVLGDWKNCYTTYRTDYIKSQFRQFLKMYKKNLIFRDVKPVYWSPSTKTALAEAELEYNDNHNSPSTYFKFQLNKVPKIGFLKGKRVYAVIWTTTPWTLPANQAICYNETLYYSLVTRSDSEDDDVYIVATKMLSNLSSVLNCSLKRLKSVSGEKLAGATYTHPIYKDQILPFLSSSHATATKGTGLVHTAPAHGHDDFLVALNNKIKIVDLVDEEGCYRKEAGKRLEGKFVLTEGTGVVLEMMKNDLLYLGEITHSYPYDWRAKKPVIIRPSRQWFIDTDAIKQRAIEVLDNVKILPNEKSDIYKQNLISQIQKRPYWCISRQRKWGVPIPVFYDRVTTEIIINENSVNHNCNLLEQHGADFWWKLKAKELLPENEYSSSKLNNIVKGEDIMDIWFDSGISWAKVLDGNKVADLYLEGVDQFTGWFQSSLLTSVAIRDKAPYKSIYVHGFAVDENGIKMSKSLGNVVDPVDIVKGKPGQKGYGVDVLRWWVICHASHVPMANVSMNVLNICTEEVQKVRNGLRFALSCLTDYEKSGIDERNLALIDKYMLHLLYQFRQQIDEHVEQYQFHKIAPLVLNLITNPISGIYYTAIKDRLYCDHCDSSTRRAAQFVLLQIFEVVSQAVGPIVPHLVEEMYVHLAPKDKKTYFTSAHVKPPAGWCSPPVALAMNVILNIRKDINKEWDVTSDADVVITFSKKKLELFKNLLMINELETQLADIFQVANVTVNETDSITDDYRLGISRSMKVSCLRCRRVQSDKEDELCKRCGDVVAALKVNKTAIAT